MKQQQWMVIEMKYTYYGISETKQFLTYEKSLDTAVSKVRKHLASCNAKSIKLVMVWARDFDKEYVRVGC